MSHDNHLSIGNSRRPLVFGNLVSGNSIGLHLRADSFDNVANGNLFFNTKRAVRDDGILNSVSSMPVARRSEGASRISAKPSGGTSQASQARARNLAGPNPSGKVRGGKTIRSAGHSRPIR